MISLMNDLLDEACFILSMQPIRRLAEGGQKLVYVVAENNGDESVLKLIDFRSNTDPAALERARREVNLLRSINHSNVVAVKSELYTLNTPPIAAFWLEEMLDGSDLRFSSSNLRGVEDLFALGRDVAAGLGALHQAKVIHRDLSPGNVQRLKSGKFVVMDPGFAKHTLRSGLTIGRPPGTPGFMTPEHVQNYSGALTAASDVFGCCALVYYAATGKPPLPYEGDDDKYFERLKSASHTPLHHLRPDLPPNIVSVIERGLHPQPARRYRNGNMLHQAFKEL